MSAEFGGDLEKLMHMITIATPPVIIPITH